MFHVEPRGERVALLRMDDGKVNAIGPAFLRAFPDAWREATWGERAVVLAGNARAFSAGLDLKALPGMPEGELAAFAGGFMGLFGEVASHPRPVVAAVDGPALAGGAVLALCADFRAVSPRARIGLTEVPVGIPFPAPVADLARQRLPPQEWAPALMRGVVREGAHALAHGWAHELHPSGDVVEAAVALAAEVAEHHPPAFASAKAAVCGDLPARMSMFAKEGASSWAATLASGGTLAAVRRGFERATAGR